MENKVQDQQQNDDRQTMPKETQRKVKNTKHNVKEKTQDYEHDHDTGDDPNPATERHI